MQSLILNSFTSGELSPKLDARPDLPFYQHGTSVLENLVIMPQGGVTKRPGTIYIGEAKDVSSEAAEDQKHRVISLIHTADKAFIIELGHLYARFYTDGSRVGTFELATPFTGRDIQDLKWVQYENSIYFAHQNYHPQKLTWDMLTDDGWTIAAPAFTADPFTAAGDYPAAVYVYEGRLIFGGSLNQPQTIWGSKAGEIENFTLGTNAADAWEWTFASDTPNRINWITAGQRLVLGTLGGEWTVDPNSQAGGIDATGLVNVHQQSTFGSSKAQPVVISGITFFLQRTGKTLRAGGYGEGGLTAPPESATMTADHILAGGALGMEWQKDPDPKLWLVRNDGQLVAFTLDLAAGVRGFSRQITQGAFRSVTVIPGETGDELWFVVERTLNGVVKKTIEKLAPWSYDAQVDHFYVDCGLTVTGSGITTVTGLEHLEGMSVDVCVDGKPHQRCTVESGSITLNFAGDIIHVGLPYTAKLRTMKLEVPTETGTSQTKRKRVSKLNQRYYQTVGAKIGSNESNLQTVLFNTADQVLGQAVPMFSGDKESKFPGSWDRDGYVLILSDQPLPFTLLALVARIEAEP